MPLRYRCKDGEMLDWICWKHYGRSSQAVEAVLAANPGLAAQGPHLREGLIIWLPDLPTPEPRPTVRLWD